MHTNVFEGAVQDNGKTHGKPGENDHVSFLSTVGLIYNRCTS